MTFLVTWLWQGLAIAWVTAIAVRTMPRLNAATRHAIWWLALAGVLAIPICHGLAAVIPEPSSAPGSAGAVDAARALILPAVPPAAVTGVAVVWAMTAVIGLLRMARGYSTLRRLKRTSLPFGASREACLPLWMAARENGHRAAELRTADAMAGACALGLGQPTILISRAVADALDAESLDEIVMHEQAHLDRYDDWSQLLLAAVSSLAGLHPAVRFLAQRVEIDREAACDDRVVSRTGAPRRYASSLLTVAALSNLQARRLQLAAGAPAATATASVLRARIRRLLDPSRDRSGRLARATSLATTIVLAFALVGSMQARPIVTFVESVVVIKPAAAMAPAIVQQRAQEPAFHTNVDAAADVSTQAPRRTLTAPRGPAESDLLPGGVFHGVANTNPDEPLTAHVEIRALPAEAHALALDMVVPSPQPTAASSAPAYVPAPWEALATSTTSAAGDLARSAAATGARAQSAGIAIGRFVRQVSKSASVF